MGVRVRLPSELQIGVWCNGNTTVFGAVFLGSNPGIPTTLPVGREA